MRKGTLLVLILVTLAFCAPPPINYPVRLTYINSINSWREPSNVAEGMGIPGYAPDHNYNYIALAFWSKGNPLDMVKVWNDPKTYLGTLFGNTK